ncbi:hypothetical protein [Paraclostridium bifermentans]|uniref:hypothetical protein n=1 Tax=Paraclostridium bifermentans TaxID=1490 RepID=UPI00359C6516
MKKLIALITVLLAVVIIFIGYNQTKDFEIEYEGLPEEYSELLTLTGNKVLKYDLKNLSNEKSYEIGLVYEVYKNSQKVKEEKILGIGYGPTKEKIKDHELAINIQDKKIRCITGENGGVYSYIDVEEDISKFSYQCFEGGNKVNFGDDIYLFHGTSGEDGLRCYDLGKLSEEDKSSLVKHNDLNVFIKLVYEEI